MTVFLYKGEVSWPDSIPPDLRAALQEVETGTPHDRFQVCVDWLGSYGARVEGVSNEGVMRALNNLASFRSRMGPADIWTEVREWLVTHEVKPPDGLPVDPSPETRV